MRKLLLVVMFTYILVLEYAWTFFVFEDSLDWDIITIE